MFSPRPGDWIFLEAKQSILYLHLWAFCKRLIKYIMLKTYGLLSGGLMNVTQPAGRGRSKRGTCIKGQIWPPLEPKTESCFSPISPNWFTRRMVQV